MTHGETDTDNKNGHGATEIELRPFPPPNIFALVIDKNLCLDEHDAAYLKTIKIDWENVSRTSNTHLHSAAVADNALAVRFLIAMGADIHATTKKGKTALMVAVAYGATNAVAALCAEPTIKHTQAQLNQMLEAGDFWWWGIHHHSTCLAILEHLFLPGIGFSIETNELLSIQEHLKPVFLLHTAAANGLSRVVSRLVDVFGANSLCADRTPLDCLINSSNGPFTQSQKEIAKLLLDRMDTACINRSPGAGAQLSPIKRALLHHKDSAIVLILVQCPRCELPDSIDQIAQSKGWTDVQEALKSRRKSTPEYKIAALEERVATMEAQLDAQAKQIAKLREIVERRDASTQTDAPVLLSGQPEMKPRSRPPTPS